MIIVSQDKREIINLNNVKNIKLDPVLDYRDIIVNLDEVYTDIGSYATEERAKEVLFEIIQVYKYFTGERYTVGDIDKLTGKFDKSVYEMPLE